jgi:hypothetical protein
MGKSCKNADFLQISQNKFYSAKLIMMVGEIGQKRSQFFFQIPGKSEKIVGFVSLFASNFYNNKIGLDYTKEGQPLVDSLCYVLVV